MTYPIEITCPICYPKKINTPFSLSVSGNAIIEGVIRCSLCTHEMPFTIANNCLQKLDTTLPGSQSFKLSSSVPKDLQEDIREAERANYARCYKAAATMCRRALQLGLVDRNIKDGNLSGMLDEAHKQKLFDEKLYSLATSIKGFGDIGAHRKEILEPQEINMLIYATVKMLNELFP